MTCNYRLPAAALRAACDLLDRGYSVIRALACLGLRLGAAKGKRHQILNKSGEVVCTASGEEAASWIRQAAKETEP